MQAANVLLRIGTGLGIAGTVGQKNAVGLQRQHIFGAGLRRHHCHLAAFAAQHAQNVVLDAVVVGHHMKTRRLVFHADHFVRQCEHSPVSQS